MGLTPSIKEYLKHKAGRETGFFDDKVSHYKYELKRRFEERKDEPIKELKLMKEAGELTKNMKLQLKTLLGITKDVNKEEALQEITKDMSKNHQEFLQWVDTVFTKLLKAIPQEEELDEEELAQFGEELKERLK